MADLKSFINTSSDRIKSAMGMPVDRIKTIQGSLLNQIPAKSLATLWLDGTIIDVAGNKYFVDRIAGNNVLITGYDFPTGWTKGFPYKSAATIDIFGQIGVPVVSLFQNFDYGNQFFTRHVAQVVDGNGVETSEPYVCDIVAYSGALTGDNLSKANTYFGVPAEQTSSVYWIDGVNGNDTTGNGSKSTPWKSITKLMASGTTGTKVYVKSATITGKYWESAKTFTLQAIGLVTLKSDATTYLIFCTTPNYTWNNFVFDGNGDIDNIVQCYQTNGNTYNNCLFKNEGKALVTDNNGVVQTFNGCVFSSRLANTTTPLVMQGSNYNTCYFLNSFTTTSGANNVAFTNCRFTQNRTNKGVISAGTVPVTIIKGCKIYTAYSGIGFIKKLDIQHTTIDTTTTSTTIISSSQNTAELVSKYNKFINNDLTPSVTTPFFINLKNPKGFDIQNNYFKSITKNEYYPIYIVCTSATVTGTKKINYNRIESGSFTGTLIRLNGETAYNNHYDGCEIIGNRIRGHRYYYPSDATSGIHGMILNGGTNMIIKYNYVSHCHVGIVIKNGESGEAYTANGAQYNLIEDCIIGMYVRGVKGLNIFNNTFYHSAISYGVNYKNCIKVDTNNVLTPNVDSENVICKNNIYAVFNNSSDEANVSFDAHAAANGCIEANGDMYGGAYAMKNGANTYATVALAKAAGLMTDTLATNPNLTNMIPVSAINNGDDLGTDYDDGIDIDSVWQSDTVIADIQTVQQGETWQCGAYVI